MKTIQNLTFCYVANGTPDLNLLEMLSFQIMYNNELWNHLEHSIKYRKRISDDFKRLLTEYVSEIFDHNLIL